nr:neurofilament heavy polypeptide-like [Penaeus vannamei]
MSRRGWRALSTRLVGVVAWRVRKGQGTSSMVRLAQVKEREALPRRLKASQSAVQQTKLPRRSPAGSPGGLTLIRSSPDEAPLEARKREGYEAEARSETKASLSSKLSYEAPLEAGSETKASLSYELSRRSPAGSPGSETKASSHTKLSRRSPAGSPEARQRPPLIRSPDEARWKPRKRDKGLPLIRSPRWKPRKRDKGLTLIEAAPEASEARQGLPLIRSSPDEAPLEAPEARQRPPSHTKPAPPLIRSKPREASKRDKGLLSYEAPLEASEARQGLPLIRSPAEAPEKPRKRDKGLSLIRSPAGSPGSETKASLSHEAPLRRDKGLPLIRSPEKPRSETKASLSYEAPKPGEASEARQRPPSHTKPPRKRDKGLPLTRSPAGSPGEASEARQRPLSHTKPRWKLEALPLIRSPGSLGSETKAPSHTKAWKPRKRDKGLPPIRLIILTPARRFTLSLKSLFTRKASVSISISGNQGAL